MTTLEDALIYNFIAMCNRFAGSSDHAAAREYLDRLDKEAEELYGSETK